MLVVLSHPLGPDTPNWPGAPNFEMRPFHSISGGDIANTHVLEVYNRQGTHVAAPSHVNPETSTPKAQLSPTLRLSTSSSNVPWWWTCR